MCTNASSVSHSTHAQFDVSITIISSNHSRQLATNQLQYFLILYQLRVLQNSHPLAVDHLLNLLCCEQGKERLHEIYSFLVDGEMQWVCFGAIIWFEQKLMRYLRNFFAFFDGLEVGMTVSIAEVFLLHHLRPHSLILFYLLHFPTLNIALTLNFCSYLSLDRCICLHRSRYVIFHSINSGHSSQGIPGVPLGLSHKLKHGWFWRITVSHRCLLVQSVYLQFDLIRNRLLAQCHELCSQLK